MVLSGAAQLGGPRFSNSCVLFFEIVEVASVVMLESLFILPGNIFHELRLIFQAQNANAFEVIGDMGLFDIDGLFVKRCGGGLR